MMFLLTLMAIPTQQGWMSPKTTTITRDLGTSSTFKRKEGAEQSRSIGRISVLENQFGGIWGNNFISVMTGSVLDLFNGIIYI